MTTTLLPFSKTYGFYILMGGLAVNVWHLHDRLQHVILTPSGVLELARKGQFFYITDANIKDKSKANLLAKGLVLVQITWTVLQCLSRKIVGLPLSILEVHILVHAGCALIMYVLWFNKPLDVDQPILVQNGIPDEITALMLVQNYKLGMYLGGSVVPPSGFEPAKRTGSKNGIWPSSMASESNFLVFNPNMAGGLEENGLSTTHNNKLSLKYGNEPQRGKNHSQIDPAIHSPTTGNASTASVPSKVSGRDCVKQSSNTYLTSRDSRIPKISIESIDTSFQGRHSGLPRTDRGDNLSNQGATNRGERLHAVVDGPSRSQPVNSNAEANAPSELDDQEFSIISEDPSGTSNSTTLSITTGEFLPGGIGPTAYPLGEWRKDLMNRLRPPFTRPHKIKQIPPTLRDVLPLQQIDHSTVKYYCPITFSLTPKMILRWQLAAVALRKEMPVTPSSCPQPHNEQETSPPLPQLPLLTFNSPGSTAHTPFFATTQHLFGLKAPYVAHIFDTYWRTPKNYHQHIIGIQRLYHNATNDIEELKLGLTSV
ncbi:MAG: hypothetical protein Q9168_006649, partial [Polycauliona sp. 1 TL-2023]